MQIKKLSLVCRYETLNTAQTKQKQSVSLGDLLDMVSSANTTTFFIVTAFLENRNEQVLNGRTFFVNGK